MPCPKVPKAATGRKYIWQCEKEREYNTSCSLSCSCWEFSISGVRRQEYFLNFRNDVFRVYIWKEEDMLNGKPLAIAPMPYNRPWNNVELIKDCGLVPFLFARDFGFEVHMIGLAPEGVEPGLYGPEDIEKFSKAYPYLFLRKRYEAASAFRLFAGCQRSPHEGICSGSGTSDSSRSLSCKYIFCENLSESEPIRENLLRAGRKQQLDGPHRLV